MRVEVSDEAARVVGERGGRLWVWASRPRLCCWGTPAYMHAAIEQPPGLPGFRLVPPTGQDGVEVWFRAPAGRAPDMLEIGCAAGATRGWRPTGTAAGSLCDPAPS
jgi:hypothetical protein